MSFNFPVLIDWFYLHHFIFLTLCLQSPFSLLLPSCSSHISSKYFLNISCFKSKSPFLLLCLQNPHPLLPKYLLVYFILSTITSVSLYHHISQKSGTLTSSSPCCSPRLVSQEGPIPSNWKHSPEVTETLRVSQDSLCSTFVYHLTLVHSLSVFQFSFLWHPWHCIVFSSYFFGHFSSLLMFLVYCHGSQLYKCRSSPGFILSHGLLLSCVLYFRDFKFSHDSNHSTWAGVPQICVSGLNISSRCWHIFQIPKHLHQALLWHPTLDVFHPWLCFCLAPHLLVCNCSGLRLSLSSHPHTTCSPTCPFQSSCISPWISPSLMSGLTGCRNSTAGCL